MAFETIRYDITDDVATITLNRPDVLNSFNATMHSELRSALKSASGKDGARALIITGEGRGFCAGQDLSDRDPDGGQVDFADSLDKNYNRMVRIPAQHRDARDRRGQRRRCWRGSQSGALC